MLYEENTGRGLFMLEYLIDDLVIWAYRNELLKDYEKRYVYEYAIQVILYNICLLYTSDRNTMLNTVGSTTGVNGIQIEKKTIFLFVTILD